MEQGLSTLRAFVSELRRRRVFRVAGVYLVAAWAVLQVATTVAPILRLPEWVPALVLYLLALGLPVALVLAWAYDLTPEGLRRAGAEVAPEAPTAGIRRPGRSATYLGIALLAVLLGLAGYARFHLQPNAGDARDERITSVAVLPFLNLSGDRANDYFSDGITEEILDALAKLPGLQVPARTSSFLFKGKPTDVREVGQQLGVGAVLEGSIQREGDRVRITAQLVNARTGYHIWSERYDRNARDLFATEDEISAAVAGKLRLLLVQRASGARPAPAQPSVDAHDHYLLGLSALNERTPAGDHRAVLHFREAIAADARYAQAYAGLALAYAVLPTREPGPRPLALADTAELMAQRASTLDPTLSTPHDALGLVAFTMRWDFPRAERELTTALRLNPNDPTAHLWYAYLLQVQGRDSAAVRAAKRAIELDPLSVYVSTMGATALFHARRYSEAETELRRQTGIRDAAASASAEAARAFLRGRIFLVHGQYDSAAVAFQTVARADTLDPAGVTSVVRGIANPGARAGARQVLRSWVGAGRNMYVLVDLAAQLRDTASALRILSGLAARHDPRFWQAKTDPLLDPLRGDPRFNVLWQGAGLAR